jgi:hypothetical protein
MRSIHANFCWAAASIALVNGKPVSFAAFEQALQDQGRSGVKDSAANGSYIVEVMAVRPFTLPLLSEMRKQLIQTLAQRKLMGVIQEQVNAAKIELR